MHRKPFNFRYLALVRKAKEIVALRGYAALTTQGNWTNSRAWHGYQKLCKSIGKFIPALSLHAASIYT